jgi:hypothetical protein
LGSCPGTSVPGLSFAVLQESPVQLFVESHEQSIADLRTGRSQIPGRAEKVRQQRVIIGPGIRQVKLRDFLTACSHKTFHAGKELQRLGPADAALVGINLFGLFDLFGLKEPLSFLARGSGAAIVNPIDLAGHRQVSRASFSGTIYLSSGIIER